MTDQREPTLLGGRYELGEPIGRGGMAEVFRGTDVRLGRDVAVKVLRADLARDPAFQSRFRQEAQAAASLNASTIVSVFDTGIDASGGPFIVMEYVQGRTLRDILHTEGRLLLQRALEVGADICDALDAAHRAGIVHRDIKPGNVMLSRAGEVKVMDFGIARAAADAASTQPEAVIGTAAYLSPEQARGENVDARSDIYSAGCLLYELITGQPPFVGDSPLAVAYQHVREDPQPPSAYDQTLTPAIDAVVLKAMAKNPANRYQSAYEMREDLLRARAGGEVLATPVLEPLVTLAPAATVLARQRKDRSVARALAYTVFGLIIVAIVISVAAFVRGLLGTSSGLIPAPALVGLDQREAAIVLSQEGLRVGEITQRQFVAGQAGAKPFGEVLTQSPDQGIVVPDGGRVNLEISGGIEMTVVPDGIVGISRADAAARLTQSRLVLAADVSRDGNFPGGTVLAVDPPSGRQVNALSPVVLTVASGNTTVPDVRGRSREEAAALLNKAGFSVGIMLQDSTGEPDLVLDQTPSGGLAERGSTVLVVVSQTPPPPRPSPSPVPSSEASPAPEPSPVPSPAPSPSPS